MQRPTYSSIPPANSPPLHHPVPQHISQVPNMRSPPPPAPQSTGPQQGGQNYGYGGQFMQPPFGGFINENTAQMGVQMAEKYMDQQFNRYVDVSSLKRLFFVSNSYVINKILIVLVPWRHKPWSRKMTAGFNSDAVTFAPPRDDLNSPDMYIPVMGLITYVLLATLIAGLRGAFDPALLSSICIWAFMVIVLELGILKLAIYFLNITSEASLLDLLAYSGYKFIGVNITILLAEVWNRGGGTGGFFGWCLFGYLGFANAFFLLRSLKYVLMPENTGNATSGVGFSAAARSQKQSRTYFLAIYSFGVQFFFMWVLSRNI